MLMTPDPPNAQLAAESCLDVMKLYGNHEGVCLGFVKALRALLNNADHEAGLSGTALDAYYRFINRAEGLICGEVPQATQTELNQYIDRIDEAVRSDWRRLESALHKVAGAQSQSSRHSGLRDLLHQLGQD